MNSFVHSVNMEHKVTDFQRSQIPLVPRMFPVWNFTKGIFVRKAKLNMGWLY